MSKNDVNDHLNDELKNNGYKFAIMLVERQVEINEKIIKPDMTGEPRKVPRIDVLVLTGELKDEFERINKTAREIARMNGRAIVSYADAEDAVKLVEAQKFAKKPSKFSILRHRKS